MVKKGLSKLRQSQRFILEGKNNVRIKFGKYTGRTFKEIAIIDPEYFDYLIDSWANQMTAEVQRRLQYWRQKTQQFFI